MQRTGWYLVLIILIVLGSSFPAHAALWDNLFGREIPVYPALRKTGEQAMTRGETDIKIMMFEGEDVSVPHAVDYYKKVLTQRGWTTAGERVAGNNAVVLQFSHTRGSVLSFMFLPADTFGRPAGSVLVEVFYIPQRGGSKKRTEALLNGQDAPGEDIPGIARYPGSIRLSSMKTQAGMRSAVYKIVDSSCVECVVDFYTQSMTQDGWKFFHATSTTKDEMLARYAPHNKTEEEAEERGKLIESLQAFDPHFKEEGLTGRMQERFPDSMKILFFQKGSLSCILAITYTVPREGHANRFSRFEELLTEERFMPQDEAGRKALERFREEHRDQLVQSFEKMKLLSQRTSKEGLVLTINVAPQPRYGKDSRSVQW